jgi:hypothetical protein
MIFLNPTLKKIYGHLDGSLGKMPGQFAGMALPTKGFSVY